jgi:isopentenyl phosphate kinase
MYSCYYEYMKKQLVLIKFGGSLITDKEKEDTPRPELIERCAEQMREVKRVLPNADMIIGTGVGSFGHIQARRYQLKKNIKPAELFYGMCTIHDNVRMLNEMVVKKLMGEKLSAFSISPSAMLMANDGVIVSSFFQPLRQLLASGCTPVLHGDAVLDPVRGLTIMSTEKVLQVCLEDLRELYEDIIVIYCMDANGISDENHKTISVLEKDQKLFIHPSETKDVTGGIEGKVESARKAAELADRVYLISGKEEGMLKQAIVGKQVGTRVR